MNLRSRAAITMLAVLGTACSSKVALDAEPSAPPSAVQDTSQIIGNESAPPTAPTDSATATSAVNARPTAVTTTSIASPTTMAPSTTVAAPTTTNPTTTPYGMPVADGSHAGYAREHHDYPASDIFVPGSCGSPIISPVNGVVLESRRVNEWDRAVDNPATRGGKSVSILGDDGVRYYFAHFESIEFDVEPGLRVEVGHLLGLMGMTGRAGACHLHFAISPPCAGKEWSVRRGVIWPWGYLDGWRRGEQLSPAAEVDLWLAAHPNACAEAMADPDAARS